MKNNILFRIIRKLYFLTYINARNARYKSRENKSKSSSFVCHFSQQLGGNSGDTVLSHCVRHTLGQDLDTKWNMIGVRESVTDTTINRINASKAAVIGGGGLFLPDSNSNSVSGWQWACSKQDLAKIKKPIILYSVGYNYFRGQKPSELFIDNLNAIIEKSAFVGLRNYGSIEKVKELVNPDLQEKIQYQPCTTTVIRKVFSGLPDKVETKNVAINIAFDRINLRLGEDYQTTLTNIARAMKSIADKGYNIYCVAHCASDLDFCQYLDQQQVQYKKVNGEYWLPEKWFTFYNEMEVVIGMRGHAQMIPFGINCKIISLISHDKMGWFLDDIQAADWGIELRNAGSELATKIIEVFEDVQEKNPEITNKRLLEQQDRLYQITVANNKKITDIIDIKGGI